MTDIQNIKAESKNGVILTLHLEEVPTRTPRKFVAIGTLHDRGTVQTMKVQESSYKEAYQEVVEKFDLLLSDQNDSIQWIDNPCNTVFITVEEQKDILDALRVEGVELRLNGEAA